MTASPSMLPEVVEASPGVLHLLARVPSDEAIQRKMAASPGLGRMQAINAIRCEQVARFRNHLAGGTRGASIATSAMTSGGRFYFREGF